MAGSFIEELADDLVTGGVTAAVGTDTFFAHLDASATLPAVALYDNGGAGTPGNPSGAVFIGVRVRGATHTAARVLANAIYDRYHRMNGRTLDLVRVLSCTANTPASIGRDEADRDLVAFNMVFTVVATDQDTVGDGGSAGYGGAKDPYATQTAAPLAVLSAFTWNLHRSGSTGRVTYTSDIGVECRTRARLTIGPGAWSGFTVHHAGTYSTAHSNHLFLSGSPTNTGYDIQIEVRQDGLDWEKWPAADGSQVYTIITGNGGAEGSFTGIDPV